MHANACGPDQRSIPAARPAGARPYDHSTDRERGLSADGASLPALLKANGYATGLIEKWHLGWKPEFGPNAHGFDEFHGFLSGAHSYYTSRQEVLGVGPGVPDLFENMTPVALTGYLTDEITRRSVRSGQWKLMMVGAQLLLFDLKVDPGERNDLSARHPDVVAKLKRELTAWVADVDSAVRDR